MPGGCCSLYSRLLKCTTAPRLPLPASSPSSLYPLATRFFFLWKASLSSFPPSVSLSASRPFLRLFTLYVAENSTLAAGLFLSPSVFQHPPPLPLLRGMLVERKWEEERLPPSSSFQFKFASAQERGAFHSQTRPCLSRLDQRRTFRHLINPADRRARVSKCRNVGTPNLKISCLFSGFFSTDTFFSFIAFPSSRHSCKTFKTLNIIHSISTGGNGFLFSV